MVGAEILGCGGGGTIESGREMLRLITESDSMVTLQKVDSVPKDSLNFIVSGVGGGVPRRALSSIKDYSLSADNPNRLQTFVAAIKNLAQKVGQPYGLLSSEIGAGNMMVAIASAAVTGLNVVDADCCGRAKPEISISTTSIYGIPVTPISIVTPFGEEILISKSVDDFRAEQLVRGLASASGGRVSCARTPIVGQKLRMATIGGSVSLARKLGEKVHEYIQKGRNIVDLITRDFGFNIAFEGKISEWFRRPQDAFMKGFLTLRGEGAWSGKHMRIDFKNEYLVAYIDGEPYVSCPDLITVIDTEKQRPLSNWANTAEYIGRRVCVLHRKANPIWYTPKGLQLFSPRHFGYRFHNVSPQK